MYAIFENGSKQYRVSVGDVVKLEKLNAQVGAAVNFPVLMCADEGSIKVGAEVADMKVCAQVVSQGKDKKIIVFKYKAKKNERKKQGHRQPFTTVKITSIGGEVVEEKPAEKKAPAKKAAASAAKKTTVAGEKKPATTRAKKAPAKETAKAE